MIGHMGSFEWHGDTHPADRVNALEARVKELEGALEKVHMWNPCSNFNERKIDRIVYAALKKEKP